MKCDWPRMKLTSAGFSTGTAVSSVAVSSVLGTLSEGLSLSNPPPMCADTILREIAEDLTVAAISGCDRTRPGSVGNFVCGRAVEHQAAMALVKRSPKRTAN